MFGAFDGCSLLKSVTMSNNVTEIQSDAFAGCKGLEYIVMSRKITQIDSYTFYNCISLKSITVPGCVTKIGREAFHGCKSLVSIILPDGICDLAKNAFLDCGRLERVICNNQEHHSENVTFMSREEYLSTDFESLLAQAGLNASSISYNELSLITNLMQADYLPAWKTIAASFKERSLYCISRILGYFCKHECMYETKDMISYAIDRNIQSELPAVDICNYLTPKDHANLCTTSNDIVFSL